MIASTPMYLPALQNPFVVSQSPFSVPGGQACARTFPVIAAANRGFTSYPPEHDDDDDEQLLYTYALFHEEPITALSVNKRHDDTWTLCIPVPIPDIENPTLLALNYMIKYATTYDSGNSTIQTDTILTTDALPEGVVTENTGLGVYYKGNPKNPIPGFAPHMVDHEKALCLSTTLAIKCNGSGEHWNHYIDNQHITPNVRVVDDCHLYVVFHVNEYPTVQTVRSLSVKVSATWQKEEVEKKAVAEAERQEAEEAKKQAELEAERKKREAEERQARLEEKNAREEERQARDEERYARADEAQARAEEAKARTEEAKARAEEAKAREEEAKAREEERQAREVEKSAKGQTPSVASAPPVADKQMQTRIKDTMERLKMEKCDAGYEFVKTETGYKCKGGGHSVTFEQLGLRK